jgi:hypothetical protein
MSKTGPKQSAAPPGRVGKRVHQRFLRATTNPFVDRDHRPLLVHCGYHKVGTVWFRQVLLSVMRPYGLRQQEGKTAGIRPDTDLAFYANAGTFERTQLGSRAFRGTHVIRDPRDLVVSGYEYHLKTAEPWALRPDERYGGQSYQEHLRSISEHDGLMVELERMTASTATAFGTWDYHQAEFLELRFEDAVSDEQATFEQVFRWYGFNEAAVEIGMAAVDRLSLKRGGALPNHARSGRAGEWRDRLAPEHVDRFKTLTGDLVVRLGYETTPAW